MPARPDGPENPTAPLRLPPAGPPLPSGPRGRAFVIARFALYALLIALGAHHLISRDDAQGAPSAPPGHWVSGTTTQGLPVDVKLSDGRVVAVDVTWRARCSNGRTITQDDGFRDAFKGDFQREGPRFADDWEMSGPVPGGQTGRLEGRLEGQAADGVARGGIGFTLSIHQGDHLMQTCESGPIGFAVDL